MKVIISGGGTGGHIFPAIAVADELKSRMPDAEILFIGAKGKMEMERVPKAGYAIEGLWIGGFQRRLTMQNLLFPVKVLSSMWRVKGIIKNFKPDVAVGFGGYASGPALRSAEAQGIPTVLQEQNSYAGVTNKILARKAKKICVAYEGMEQFFPKEKIVLTGNPVRKDIGKVESEEMKLKKKTHAIQYFGLEDNKKTILILGGSLGARTLNQAMEANAGFLKDHPEIQVLWQCGKLYYEEYKTLEAARLPNVKITPFLDRMDAAYAVADVVIARAGALTVSELCLEGKPSILIPSPNVAEDHQTKNAMALVNKAAAVLIKDANAKEDMITEAVKILNDDNLSKRVSDNILKLGKSEAAKEIADVVIAAARKN